MIQKFLAKSLVLLLVVQFTLAPWAYTQSNDDPTPEEFSQRDAFEPASENEALKDAQDLRDVIESGGESERVRLRMDTFGFYDLIADEDFAKTRATVVPNAVDYAILADGHFQLRTGGKVILTSRFTVNSVFRFGDFLLFLEENSFQSEKSIQHVSYIDLKLYSPMFGKSMNTPPIFTLPVVTAGEAHSFQVKNGKVFIQSTTKVSEISSEALEIWSRKIYALALDVTAKLINPSTYEGVAPVVEELEQYYLDAANHAAMNDLPEQMQANSEIRKTLVEALKNRKLNIEDLKKDERTKAGIQATQDSIVAQKKFLTRLRLLWQHMSYPNAVQSAQVVREGLATAAFGLTAKRNLIDRLRQVSIQSRIATVFGVGVAAAAVTGEFTPVELSRFFYEALDITSRAIHGTWGWSRDLFTLGGHGVVSTVKGFVPENFYQAYLADGKAPKFAVMISAIFGTGLAILATPLLVVNSWMLARDLSKTGFSLNSFVERQRKQLADYLDVQAESQQQLSERFGASSDTKFTSEDTAEVQKILADISVRDRNVFQKILVAVDARTKNLQSRFIDPVRKWNVFKKSKHDGAAALNHDSDSATIAEHRIRGFGGALSSFVASYPSVTEGFTALIHGWQGFTIFRRIFWSPTLWVVQSLYPNYSNVQLGDGSSRDITLPSVANGGLDPLPKAMFRVGQFLTFSKQLDLIRAWENKIIPIEKQILGHAMKDGFAKLVARVRSQNGDVENLFKNGSVSSFSDSRLAELSFKQRVFYIRYVESVTARSLNKILSEILKKNFENEAGLDASDPENLLALKNATLQYANQLEVNPEDLQKIVASVIREGQALRDAEVAVDGFKPRQVLDNLRIGAAQIIDPKNTPTFKRIQVVLEMLKKPDSMPRAVRATLSSLVMAKVIGVALALVALSGQDGTILQPFYPNEMFGPNSYFYMGRYPFVNGLLVGLGTALFANAWIKLQQDASHAQHFGEVPSGEDAKKGYLKWYWKQTFKNPENSFWGNQKTYWTIIWGNMKPAFVLMLFSNLIGLGRFDVDGYIVGYAVAYGVINNGFNMKLEQGFEFASYYPLKDFPERLRGHPMVQEFLARKQQTYRFYFAFYEKFFVDIQESILGNFQRMGGMLATVTYKNEALSRMIFGGFTPTELIYSGAEWVKEKAADLPVVGKAVEATANFCEKILTNNYTSWDKVKGPGGDAIGGHGAAPPPNAH